MSSSVKSRKVGGEQSLSGEISQLISRISESAKSRVEKEREELIKLIRAVHGLEELESALKKMTEIGEVRGHFLSLRPSEIPFFLALTPRNVAILLRGRPGVGKTSSVDYFARLEAEALGREYLNLEKYERNIKDLLDVIEQVQKSPEKFYIASYLKGWDITRETFAIPISSMASLREMLEYPTLTTIQKWIIPPKVAIFLVPPEKWSQAESEHPELREVLHEYISGEVPLINPRHVRVLLEYFPLGVLFIDEALQAFPDFVKMYIMGLAGERHWGGYKLSPLARLIFAYNPAEFNKAVATPPEPFYRRVAVVEVIPPTVEDFLNYVERKLRLMGYGELSPLTKVLIRGLERYLIPTEEIIERAVEELGGAPYPTPASLFRFIVSALPYLREYERTGSPELAKTIAKLAYSTVGSEVGSQIEQMLRIVVPPAEEIIRNPELFKETIQRYASEQSSLAPILAELARSRMLLNLINYVLSRPEYASERARQLGQWLANILEKNLLSIRDVQDLLSQLLKEAERQFGGSMAHTVLANVLQPLVRTKKRELYQILMGAYGV